MIRTSLTMLLASTLLSSCTMIPDLLTPSFSAAKEWNKVDNHSLELGDNFATEMDWKTFFNSPELHLIIGTALQNNKDLKIAALNVDEARALYRIDRASLYPGINANGSMTRANTPEEASLTGQETISSSYEANVGITSYELDLFGKIRSSNESAINEYLATQQAQAVVRNSLIAEVANAYLQLLADQKLLKLTIDTLNSQKKTYDLLTQSLESGVVTEQDVARSATAVETAQVNYHLYSRYVAQDKNALFVLLGIPYDESFLPKSTLDDVHIKNNLNPGLPSKTLLLRPDIRQAEYELLARNANIGAARAAFFPSITLTGAYGSASQSLNNLFASGAMGAWSFIPQITLPIFQGGQNKANLDLAEIRTDQAIVNYEKTIQVAFQEISDELAARATLDKQLESQKRLVSAASSVYSVSTARYNSGIDSFLDVLDAQRELYTYQQQEILIQRQKLSNLVNLYKVLGGGSRE